MPENNIETVLVKDKFGLRFKSSGKIVTHYKESNGCSDCCGEFQHVLSERDTEEIWSVDTPENAEWVRLNSTQWYNAEYDTPTNDLDPEDLEVVKINIIISTSILPVQNNLPTQEEFYTLKYKEREPEHYEHMMN